MINFQELEKVAEFKNGELNWLEGRDINAVYVILVGDEYYIGSSHYTYLRIGQHLNELQKGTHHSEKFQAKFNEVLAFDVFILERGIEKPKLKSTEFEYIKKLKPSLNISLTTRGEEEYHKIETLGGRIKWHIRQKGYTIEQVAEKIGVTRVTLTQNLSRNPTINTLRRIAEAIGCKVGDFFLDEIQIESDNTIVCPKCGAKFELKEE